MRVSESSLHLEDGHLRSQNALQHDRWNIFLYETHLGTLYLLGGMILGTLARITYQVEWALVPFAPLFVPCPHPPGSLGLRHGVRAAGGGDP